MENIDRVEVDALVRFTEWVNKFCKESGLVEYKNDPIYEKILATTPDELMAMSSDDCFVSAITLMNYAGYLQKKLDVLNSQYNWCVEALNYLFAKYWNNYDKYLPADLKKQSIIQDNSYAQSVEASRLKLYAGIQLLTETCKDVKKRVTLFQDLAKSRSFK